MKKYEFTHSFTTTWSKFETDKYQDQGWELFCVDVVHEPFGFWLFWRQEVPND